MESPRSPEKQVQINTLRQRQFWTASFVSGILYTRGLMVDSEKLAYAAFAGVMITGFVALINRVGNDTIINERERLQKTK